MCFQLRFARERRDEYPNLLHNRYVCYTYSYNTLYCLTLLRSAFCQQRRSLRVDTKRKLKTTIYFPRSGSNRSRNFNRVEHNWHARTRHWRNLRCHWEIWQIEISRNIGSGTFSSWSRTINEDQFLQLVDARKESGASFSLTIHLSMLKSMPEARQKLIDVRQRHFGVIQLEGGAGRQVDKNSLGALSFELSALYVPIKGTHGLARTVYLTQNE